MTKKVDRNVTWGEGKLPVLRFKKDKKCPDCKKKCVLNKEWGEWCWNCGAILDYEAYEKFQEQDKNIGR